MECNPLCYHSVPTTSESVGESVAICGELLEERQAVHDQIVLRIQVKNRGK